MTINQTIVRKYPQAYAQEPRTVQDLAAEKILTYAGKPGMLNKLKCLNQEQRLFLRHFIRNLHQGIDISKKANLFFKKICPILDKEKPENSFRQNFVLAIKKLFSKFSCSHYIYSHELDRQIRYFHRNQVFKDFENPVPFSYTFYD